ncbi:MAG TPA: tetratricopeptide repeat protein, partial [Gemmataceae bacterium]|nr:tetratricopeptide repeat protein [Gemmataceae bacterium]
VALGRAEEAVEQAKQMPTGRSDEATATLVVWRQAADALGQAEAALSAGTADDNMRQRVTAARMQVEAGRLKTQHSLALALRREKLFRDLDEARVAWSTVNEGRFDYGGAATKYGAAFMAYGLDVSAGQPDDLVRQISAAEREVREALVVALAEWANHAAASKTKWAPQKLRALAKAADDDGWRARYHVAVAASDVQALRDLASEARELPLPVSSLDLLATDLYSCGLRDEAVSLLRWARMRHPADFLFHFRLGSRLHTGSGRTPLEIEEAIGCYRAALALRPGSSVVHNNLGNVLRDRKELDEATAEFEKSIELGPDYAQPHNGLGLVLYDKKQFDAAMHEFKKAIELDPKLARAHNNLGAYWHDMKQWDKAMVEYHKAIELDSTDGMPHNGLGNVFRVQGKLNAALLEYEMAIELDPSDASAHNGLGNILGDSKKFKAAITAYEKAIALEPGYAQPHNGLGTMLYHMKHWEGAIAAYKKSIALDPSDAKVHNNLGIALYAIKQLNEAVAEFRKAIELDPNFLAPHNELGKALFDNNQLDEALTEIQKSIDIDPENPGPRYNLGRALHCLGQFADALEAMRKADALGSGKPGWSMPSGPYVKRLQHLIVLKNNDPREPVSMESAHKGIRGQLTKEDFLDDFPLTRNCFRKSFPIEFKGGQAYQIDVTGDFDVYLHIDDDHNFVTLAFNDDVTPPKNLDSRLVFTPQKDGIYRLVVTSANPGATGKFTLSVSEVTKTGPDQTIQGELKKSDADIQGKFLKFHKVDLVAGRPYVFELDSARFDSFLALFDPAGKQRLAYNDDAGEFILASRIDFTPTEAGTYQLVVTSPGGDTTGAYTLRIQGYEAVASRAKKSKAEK